VCRCLAIVFIRKSAKDRELNNIGNPNRKGLAFGRYAFGHSKGFRPNAKPLQVIGFILFSFLNGIPFSIPLSLSYPHEPEAIDSILIPCWSDRPHF